MKKVKIERWNPAGKNLFEEKLVLDLLMILCPLGGKIKESKVFPDIDEINDELMKGRGDDGFIGMTWEPFSLSENEYNEVNQKFSLEK